MSIVSVLATASPVIAQLIEDYSSVNTKTRALLYILMAMGFGGFRANSLQFGMDQLRVPDLSTTEIKSFII